MTNNKIIYFLLGRAQFALMLIFLLPIAFAASIERFDLIMPFAIPAIVSMVLTTILTYNGNGHARRIKIIESAAVMVLIWPTTALIGAAPFVVLHSLMPVDAFLETMSDLTSAGLSLMPSDAPYILRIWQSTLMWFGSFIFLSLLVTILPEVSGCFGLELSLSQGQIFSPMIGQMHEMAKKILIIYEVLTIISFGMFKLSGLDNWDSLIMALRCISTGGGDFFPVHRNFYVDYAAIFSMLLSCGNFLLYFRLFNTIVPPASSLDLKTPISVAAFAKRVRYLVMEFFILIRRNVRSNCRIFFANSEVQFLLTTIFVGMFLLFLTIFSANYIADGNRSFRMALFHIVSYLSTTGLTISDVTAVPDFDRYFLFMLALVGGCMGSVTGGLKIIRVIVLFKLASIEILRALHPRMIANVKVSGTAVPRKIVGRILTFFFLCAVTLFVFSVILSLSGQNFSVSVAMSLACLTNVGPLPGLCGPEVFLALPMFMKLFCCVILVAGRIEIFALLILIFYLKIDQQARKW